MDRKTPRLMRWRVIVEKKFSPALSQDPEVGVKWEHPARVAVEPGFHFGVLMGGVIVEDGVHQLAWVADGGQPTASQANPG